jgi:hypothetical protein
MHMKYVWLDSHPWESVSAEDEKVPYIAHISHTYNIFIIYVCIKFRTCAYVRTHVLGAFDAGNDPYNINI